MTGTKNKAANKIETLFVVGALLLLVGIVLAGATMPGEELGFTGAVEETGSEGGFLAGLVTLGIGQLVVMVGVIAAGVRLGLRAHDTPA
jgi:hypothetical protein